MMHAPVKVARSTICKLKCFNINRSEAKRKRQGKLRREKIEVESAITS
jgi:hypothetical protein